MKSVHVYTRLLLVLFQAAKILTLVYACVMMSVMIGIAESIVHDYRNGGVALNSTVLGQYIFTFRDPGVEILNSIPVPILHYISLLSQHKYTFLKCNWS